MLQTVTEPKNVLLLFCVVTFSEPVSAFYPEIINTVM